MAHHETRLSGHTGFPVSAIMQRERIQHGLWHSVAWRLLGFVAGEEVLGGESRSLLVHEDETRRQYVWTGFTLRLYRDSAESYWYNLVGSRPSLFLICHDGPGGEPEPFNVTADHDEAGAHMEAEDRVYSAPIPPEIHRWLEGYVMDNYRPAPPRKRKRSDWRSARVGAWSR